MITRDVKAGDKIRYADTYYCWTVHHVRNNIAYSCENENECDKCFIYVFADGEYNHMHTIIED